MKKVLNVFLIFNLVVTPMMSFIPNFFISKDINTLDAKKLTSINDDLNNLANFKAENQALADKLNNLKQQLIEIENLIKKLGDSKLDLEKQQVALQKKINSLTTQLAERNQYLDLLEQLINKFGKNELQKLKPFNDPLPNWSKKISHIESELKRILVENQKLQKDSKALLMNYIYDYLLGFNQEQAISLDNLSTDDTIGDVLKVLSTKVQNKFNNKLIQITTYYDFNTKINQYFMSEILSSFTNGSWWSKDSKTKQVWEQEWRNGRLSLPFSFIYDRTIFPNIINVSFKNLKISYYLLNEIINRYFYFVSNWNWNLTTETSIRSVVDRLKLELKELIGEPNYQRISLEFYQIGSINIENNLTNGTNKIHFKVTIDGFLTWPYFYQDNRYLNVWTFMITDVKTFSYPTMFNNFKNWFINKFSSSNPYYDPQEIDKSSKWWILASELSSYIKDAFSLEESWKIKFEFKKENENDLIFPNKLQTLTSAALTIATNLYDQHPLYQETTTIFYIKRDLY